MIASRVIPRPFSSFTSRIVPTAGPSAVASCSSRNRWARPMRVSSKSGMPSPNLALTGITARFVLKSSIRSYRSAESGEGQWAGGIDEEEAGDTDRSPLDGAPAILEDCRKGAFCRADVLRDPAGLAAGHASAANPIEEGRLAMVHVPQDGHDGLANGGHRRRTKNPTLLNGWPPRSWARLLPQPRLVDPRVRVNLIRLEEQRDFAFRALGRVGTVDNVPANREGEVPADRSRFGLRGIGLAHHLSDRSDHAVAFEDHRDDGPRADVVHQRLEERFSLVFRVVGLADGTTHADEFQRRDLQTAALESGEDFPDEAALHRVRL